MSNPLKSASTGEPAQKSGEPEIGPFTDYRGGLIVLGAMCFVLFLIMAAELYMSAL